MIEIFIVDSIENHDPAEFPQFALIETASGELYQVLPSDDLAGFGSFFSKIAGIAAPFVSMIPGVGAPIAAGLSVVSALTAPKDLNAKYAAQFQQIAQLLAQIENDVDAGKVSGASAQVAYTTFHEQWQAFKFSVPEKEQGFLYKTETEQMKPIWDRIQGKINAAIERDKQTAQTSADSTALVSGNSIFGMDFLTFGIVAVGVIFLFRRA